MKTITFEEVVCCKCGTTFQMDAELDELRQEDGETFYCPNGHAQSYTESTESEMKKLRDELAEVKKELAETQVENRRLKCSLLNKPPERKTLLQRLKLKA
jgi:septal ring factor EnvC (AmiA/AmiB activator)